MMALCSLSPSPFFLSRVVPLFFSSRGHVSLQPPAFVSVTLPFHNLPLVDVHGLCGESRRDAQKKKRRRQIRVRVTEDEKSVGGYDNEMLRNLRPLPLPSSLPAADEHVDKPTEHKKTKRK